jgi:hypothetical protein
MGHEHKLSSNNYIPSVLFVPSVTLTEHSAKLSKTVYPPSPNKLYRVSLSVPSVWLKTLGTLDIPSVVELYRVHSVDTYMYRVSDNLHSV